MTINDSGLGRCASQASSASMAWSGNMSMKWDLKKYRPPAGNAASSALDVATQGRAQRLGDRVFHVGCCSDQLADSHLAHLLFRRPGAGQGRSISGPLCTSLAQSWQAGMLCTGRGRWELMRAAAGGPTVRVDVLGPLRLVVGGDAVEVRGPKRRAILALLAMAEGRVVAVDHLVDALWPSEPPELGRAAVHSHVSRLRKSRQSG